MALTPYNIQVGHNQVKSMDNLPRCAKWLADLNESSPREAQRVMRALPITHHADLEERAQGRPRILLKKTRLSRPELWRSVFPL